MTSGDWRVARIAGIDVRIGASWVLILFLIVSAFNDRVLTAFPGTGAVTALLLATAGAVVFFGCILVHELAHALVGRRRGYEVTGITLFVFGGVTHAKVRDQRPRDEFLVSVVGPVTSALVGAGLLAAAAGLGGRSTGPAVWLLSWLGSINLFLAVFNLLPGLPLDGGRVLRSLVWAWTRDRTLATRVAGRAGVLIGSLLIAYGLVRLSTAGDLGGLWSAAIGWFLLAAARGAASAGRPPRPRPRPVITDRRPPT